MVDQIGISGLFSPPTPQQCTERTLADALMGAASVNISTFGNLERIIWANPWGLTPQQVFDLLEDKGGQLLTLKSTLMPLLSAAATAAGTQLPMELKPEGVVLTVAEDGSVKVG